MSLHNAQSISVQSFVALRRNVADLQRAAAFYCGGLGFHIADTGSAAGQIVLTLGAQRMVLVESRAGAFPRVPGPDVLFQHMAIVASEMGAAFARLQKFAPIAISCNGPQRLPAASGGALAFKFRDPDGHPVELIAFPAGQGAARWRAQSRARDAGPTLGIDHAAISVAHADRSIAFYQQLGFRLGSRQINRGIEQAHLDGLAGLGVEVEVEVVALIPVQVASPHLELLAYHVPAPTRCDGQLHAGADQLVWMADAVRAGAVPLGDQSCPRVAMDPDGHMNLLVK